MITQYYIPIIEIDLCNYETDKSYIERESERLLAKGCELALITTTTTKSGAETDKVFLCRKPMESDIGKFYKSNKSIIEIVDIDKIKHLYSKFIDILSGDVDVLWYKG